MNKQDLIDEFKKEIEVTKNVSNFEEHVNLYEKGKRIGLEFGWMLAEKLDEPEQVVCAENERTTQLVEIPQFVDKWVRSFDSEGGSKWDLLGVVTNMTSANVSKADTDIFNWLNDGNRKLFMDAITNGYTIEPQKTLQVIIKNYDRTVFTTELPEDEAMKLIDQLKEVSKKWK